MQYAFRTCGNNVRILYCRTNEILTFTTSKNDENEFNVKFE